MVTKANVVQDKPNPNARPKPADSRAHEKPTSATAWKQKAAVGTLVTVPSGNQVRVRTPGMQVFLREGVIPNGLMPIIQESMASGVAPSADAGESLLNDPEKLQEILDLADAITIYCCLDPRVASVPTEEIEGVSTLIGLGDERRDDDILYVDEMDLNDKMFIFQFAVGGTASLEDFRAQQGSNVVTLPE